MEIGDEAHDTDSQTAGKRLVWFVALWCGGVLAISVVGLAIKLIIKLQFPGS